MNFEYKTVDLYGSVKDVKVESESVSNNLGRQGWELVSVIRDGGQWLFVFKRPN